VASKNFWSISDEDLVAAAFLGTICPILIISDPRFDSIYLVVVSSKPIVSSCNHQGRNLHKHTQKTTPTELFSNVQIGWSELRWRRMFRREGAGF
jgi:hypothetical protein